MALSRLQREFIEHLCVKEDTGLTDARWADMVGLKPEQVGRWQSNAEFKSALERAKADYDAITSPLKKRTFAWLLEEAVMNYDHANTATERRHWWGLMKDMTKSEEHAVRVDYGDLDDDALWALVTERSLIEEAALIEHAMSSMESKGGKK